MKVLSTFGFFLLATITLISSSGCHSEAHHTVEITTSNFEKVVLNNEKPVLIDFWAPWCGPCVALAPTIEKLAGEYKGQIVVGKLNVDEQSALAEKYEINAIPALLFFKNGELVKTLEDNSKSEIQQAIENMLEK